MRLTVIRRTLFALLLLSSSGFSSSGEVSGLLFLSNSVLSELPKQDVAAFRAAITDTLDTVADRRKATWHSSSTSTQAQVEPLATYQQQPEQQTCRKTRITLTQTDRTVERYQFDFCRSADGWNIAHTPASDFSRDDWQLLGQTLQRALEDNSNGEPSSWTNHRSQSSGVLVPISSEMRSGKSCRQTTVTLFNERRRASNASYLFCRDSQGHWQRWVD